MPDGVLSKQMYLSSFLILKYYANNQEQFKNIF